jgi:hypothetical protein
MEVLAHSQAPTSLTSSLLYACLLADAQLGERKGVIHDVSDVLLPMSKAQLKARVVPVA